MTGLKNFFESQKTNAGSAAIDSLAVPNQVTVWPGGAVFSTIQAAIDSIPNQTGPDYYSVFVGPGVYNERVSLKPWVIVMGGEADEVTISGPPCQDGNSGAVTAASNSGLNGLTVLCSGGKWGDYSTALYVAGAQNFRTDGVIYNASDDGVAGINLMTVQIDTWSKSPSQMEASNCQFLAVADANQSIGSCLTATNSPKIKIHENCIVSATGGYQNFGVVASNESTLLLQDSTIDGSTWSIYLPQGNGNVTAENCIIDGHVSKGVVIKNDDSSIADPVPLELHEGESVKTITPNEAPVNSPE